MGKFVKLLRRRRARGKVCNGAEWKQLNWGAEQKVPKFRSDFQTLRSVICKFQFRFGESFLCVVEGVLYIGKIYAGDCEKINGCLAESLKESQFTQNHKNMILMFQRQKNIGSKL